MAIIETTLEKESKQRYLTYALSVVSSRALPDVRHGLKPVQRRILFDMYKHLNLMPGGSHRKSAAVVGGVLARFHPHGDTACYEAMVRMAQDFSLRYPLVDGQGNFGSLDGDSAAAYRYTEVKLREIALEVLGEIEEETVNFRDNFDGTQLEPMVLPSRVPNLLINGAMGIAVGMATSIPPHNLKDTISAIIELLDDPDISVAKLTTSIKGPDFPTGCAILNTKKELEAIYQTGRGAIRMRGDWEVEELGRGKKAIIITSIPYSLDKSQLVEKIANLIIEKKIPQLVDVRDESTTDVRIVLELAANVEPELPMAYLFKNTPLESNFPVNLTALVPTSNQQSVKPEQLSLKSILQHFIDFRRDVVEKKLIFEKTKLLERMHILEGFVIIYDALDEALKIVRKSEGRSDAAHKLAARFKLSEVQSFAVVDMKIYQISKTSIDDIRAELKEKETRVKEIDAILSSKKKITAIVRKDLTEISDKYGDKRRSKLVKENIEIEFKAEDYVVQEDVYAIVTKDGWIKRIRQTNELGTTRLREGDSVLHAHPLNTRDAVAIFTNVGNLYVLQVADFPSSSGYGDPIQKILKFKDGEIIANTFAIPSTGGADKEKTTEQQSLFAKAPEGLKAGDQLVLVSERGMGFVLKLDDVSVTKRTGRRVMKLRDGDKLVYIVPHKRRVAMLTRNSVGLTILTSELPVRDSAVVGVIAIGVRDDDALVAAIPFDKSGSIKLTLQSGNDKEIPVEDVKEGKRGLKGNKVIARGEIVKAEKA